MFNFKRLLNSCKSNEICVKQDGFNCHDSRMYGMGTVCLSNFTCEPLEITLEHYSTFLF